MISVLLVDDHALVRSGFAMMLSVVEDIHVVGQAVNGQEAIDRVAEQDVDVVLMDVQMPVMDGIEATRRIVAAGGTKVIILTTFDRDDYLFSALRCGASGFLLKNADPDDLVDAIHAVVEGHALLAPEATLKVIRELTGSGEASTDAAATRPATERTVAAGQLPPNGTRPGQPSSTATGGSPPHGTDNGPSPAVSPRPHLTPAAAAGAGEETGSHGSAPVRTPQQQRVVDSLTDREAEVMALMAQGMSNAEIAQRLVLGAATIKTHVSNLLAKTGSRDRVQAVVFAYRAGLVGPGADIGQ